MTNKLSLVATGDSFITRRLVKNEKFNDLASIIQAGDVRFTNLEITCHRFEGYPSAISGGTWAIAPPEVLGDLKDYGFNILNWATNHTMDYLYGGLEATKKYIEEFGFVHAGVGEHLKEASSPKYLETASGRIALIAVTSTFADFWIAGEQRPDMKGRPGVNPLRVEKTFIVKEERLEQLKSIARLTNINAEHNLAVKEGFVNSHDDKTFVFGEYRFVAGGEEGMKTDPVQEDMNRVKNAISEAKRQADYVLVSIHSHEMAGDDKSKPAQFLETFSRNCIDAGAHAVIGHGPHILRGIEIYKNRPIFYSLGNFIFQNETVSSLPADFYFKYDLNHEHNVADALDKRTNNNTKGLGVNPYVWESVIATWTMEDEELRELTLYPIELGFGLPRYSRGWPELSQKTSILEHLQNLSAPYGTRIEIEGSVGKIRINP